MEKIILFVTFIFLLSCTEEEKKKELQTIKADNFSIDLPQFMVKRTKPTTDTVFEYEIDSNYNSEDELYLAVYKDAKTESGQDNYTLEEYYKFVADDLLDVTLAFGSLKNISTDDINQLHAKIFEIEGSYETGRKSLDFYFMTAVIEGKDYFYEVSVWTRIGTKEKYKLTMENILKSFREI
ncbi:MAG: hypothetical protein A2W91_03370 [Bacteroidetes bacterium GWF2_38_335]|nr:MAG: hypothetical protein A2W91_03370 [Bacteroidetes bacterium GWF2_38_335]OFY77474.1 MAG: hypothetical protein A2281_01390 [Bacteroidetes bacterium RIFOXYA12_FULL_38_20]HBS87234.1 hypothetical protein [Bacteroidales bacterium]